MHAALRKVGSMHPDLLDEQVRIWASKVRELSYDMEDVIDAFLILSLEGDNLPLGKMIKVSIVGSGGMGKTTLARAVYDSVKGKFQCSAFVPVGQNQDLKRVFMDVLNDLDKEKFDNIHSTKKDVRLLMNEFYDFLENKRYIIVIDDIWKFDAWDMIAKVLGDSSCGSRVIITTRISEIAEEVGHVYEIKHLSDVDSRRLLHRRILSGEDQCPDDDYDLEEVCDEILRKCEGVPLAIVTTSSLLESKPREDWSELYRSIALGAKDNRHVDNTMKILSLSFYHLPYHLRTCLLYLSAFPEDYLIEAENEDYILGCRVHDMVLGLIRSLSSSENFVTVLGIEQYNTSHQGYGRRIAILSSKNGLPPVVNLGTAQSQVTIRSFSANAAGQFVEDLRVLCTQFEGAPATDIIESLGSLRKIQKMHAFDRWAAVGQCVPPVPVPEVLRQADMEILGRLRMLRRIGIHDTLLFRKLRFCTMATTSIRFVPPPAAVTTPVSVMPYLELLHFSLDVHFFKDRKIAFDIGLEHLPSSLRTVKVFVLCHLAKEEDVKEAEAALLHSVSIHPSRPALQLERLAEDKMLPSHLKDDQ
ncbi:hypothetical protein OsI_23201 [Oryza sativa Indica Group]|uniref:NB-ARC domain-containing protein n=1 Tax=Oryza sativa subsp. indica TaxID=39946 RepID=B8B354_ORYSI|nr:hypothetical protein OsI_23201 [Oryza sativa Indica Group]